jgi:hypothetical protein
VCFWVGSEILAFKFLRSIECAPPAPLCWFNFTLNELIWPPGSKVVHQSPPGCIAPEPDVDKPRFFDFGTMAEYILPRQAFCNRYVTICDPENKYRILGHPVCITNEKYDRNEFMFNFCIVIHTNVDKTPYEAVVRRLASTFTEMEIQNHFLSREEAPNSQDRRSIAALIEIIKEDLNNYNECMIPVGKFQNSNSASSDAPRRCQYHQYEALSDPQAPTTR